MAITHGQIEKHKEIPNLLPTPVYRNTLLNRPLSAFFSPRSPAELYGVGASILLRTPPGQVVNFFSLHLDYTSYGPYAANNKEVISKEQIMAGERSKGGWARAQNIVQLLADEEFKKFV